MKCRDLVEEKVKLRTNIFPLGKSSGAFVMESTNNCLYNSVLCKSIFVWVQLHKKNMNGASMSRAGEE